MTSFPLSRAALLVVDVQRGFTSLCPDELPVPGGVEIVPQVNRLLALPFRRLDASIDWHPPDHRSFHGQKDGHYPPHCVRDTTGAEFVPGLDTHRFGAIWRKGYDRDFEAYALTAQHPEYVQTLRGAGVEVVVVCGIATNVCCFFAARDLRRAGFRVVMAQDASAGIDVPAAGLFQAKAKEEGLALGIEYVMTADVIAAAGGANV